MFNQAGHQDQTSMLHEWVLMALPNFVQRSPISHSVWCLTVFFIASSSNRWLQATFPHLQNRFGMFHSDQDKRLFCLAARNFHQDLDSDEQKKVFVDTFKAAAQSCPHTPYQELLKSLQQSFKTS